jgi:Tfp pilus assembly protein FimT
VVGIVGTLTLFALPKFSGLAERNNLQAAREEITSAIATARAAAVQKGRTSTLKVTGNAIRVTVMSADGSSTVSVVPLKSLNALYSVSIAATDTVITYDMRGFASPRLAATSVFRITKGARQDSVCITTTGQIMPRGCSL